MPTMMPLMDKDTVRYITQNITPEEAQYVADIKSTIDDAKVEPEKNDDLIYITKIIAFYNKFKLIFDKLSDSPYRTHMNDFVWRLETYKQDVLENVQSIIGTIQGGDITKIELPISDNPLELLNELKIAVVNWFKLHEDDMEYEGCRSDASNFLSVVHKAIYVFRLAKISKPDYGDTQELPNPNVNIPETLYGIGIPQTINY